LPVGFVGVLVGIKVASQTSASFQKQAVPATFPAVAFQPFSFRDYVTALQAERICVDNGSSKLQISGIDFNGYNWQVPLVKCDRQVLRWFAGRVELCACVCANVLSFLAYSRLCTHAGQDAQPFCEYSILGVTGSDAGGLQRSADFKDWVYATYPEVTTTAMPFHNQFDFVRVFSGNSATEFKYALRQNSTNFNAPEDASRPSAKTTPDTAQLLSSYAKDDNDVCDIKNGGPTLGPLGQSCTGQYMYNGVLTVQRLLGDYVLNRTGASANGYSVAEDGVQYVHFPTPPYEKNGFYASLGSKLTRGYSYVVCATMTSLTHTFVSFLFQNSDPSS
jgi:hypothetical protein